MVFVDFESRSPVDIWNSGAWVYSTDPRTEVLCLAYAEDDGEIQLWLPGMAVPQLICDAVLCGTLFEAHNVFFERCIWQNILAPRFNFPSIPDNQWRCSMALCSAMGIPRSLDKAAEALHVHEQKDKEGAAIMRKLAKSCDILYPVLVQTHDLDLKRLYEYCKQDVRTERAISKKLPGLSPFELSVWQLDQEINARGVCVDVDAVNKALPLLAAYTKELNQDLFNLTGGEVSSATQRDGILRWVRKNGLPIADSLTKAQVSEWLQLPNLPEEVRAVLEIRSEIGKTSVAKYEVFKDATGADGRLRDTLVYCGAGATGRWAGKLVQLHNLPADKTGTFDIDAACEILKNDPDTFRLFYPDLAAALSFCLRGMVIASPGNDLIVADYATIEVRVLAWLANEHKLLNSFAKNRDVYLEMASAIFKRDVTKADKPERQLGKQAVLGCGYGMGKAKFEMTCKSYGITINAMLADKAVSAYRSTYKAVPLLWREVEDKFRQVLRAAPGTTVWTNDKKIAFGKYREWLLVRLPSGRCLSYFKPSINDDNELEYMTVNSVTRQWEKTKTYGGKLVENISQATARDIMAYAMTNCEKNGYPLVLSVHDELVADVPENTGSVDDFCKVITTLPAWAQGCPIKAEGWRGKRYKK